MKIKEVIEDIKMKKILKLKNDSKNSKNISRTFSGVVVECGVSSFSDSP